MKLKALSQIRFCKKFLGDSFFATRVDIDIHEEQKNESTTKFTAKDRICDSALKGKICDNSAQIKKAFSLIQLSLILLVISIVIAGIVSVSSNQTTNQKLKNSNDNIKTIYQALEKYLVNNKSLPCPASLKDIKSSATTYGQAVTTSNCVGSGIYQSNSNGNLVYGMVPVQTLGLKDEFGEDAYGNKIVYIVDSRLTTVSGFETNSGNSTIISINSGETINALFVVMSRGANAAGAFPANSATATSASSISGEQNNDLTNIVDASLPAASTADFGVTFTQSSNDSGFDDIVFYKTREQLLGDTNYWSIISCPSYISNESYGNFTWPKGYENQIVASTTSCPIGWQGSVTYPTKKCGSKGVWGYNVNDCTVSKNCSVSVTGSNTTSVSGSSGSISCDKSGYTGSVTYVCSPRTGVATITGSCTQLSKNCSVSVTGVSTASVTNDSGTLTCDQSGYSGSVSYTCSSYSGAAANITGSCAALNCSVSVSGVSTTSVSSPSGTLNCDQSGYSGSVSYTCSSTSGAAANITGSCTLSQTNCTGGTITTANISGTNYVIHTFNSSGTLTCSISKTVSILVVGAGGSGGAHTSINTGTGGGGGGGVIYVASASLAIDSYTITVAPTTSGKAITTCAGVGNKGASSIFRNSNSSIVITANGGGGGGGACTGGGQAGGSGGGAHHGASGGTASAGTIVGVSGTAYASAGGAVTANNQHGAGGGGATQVGAAGTSGGNGGQGLSLNISGTSVVYGSGGGGNGNTLITAGGIGGTNAGNGANNGSNSRVGLDAVANTGGGGGGNGYSNVRSGDGGSGIVIVRYAN